MAKQTINLGTAPTGTGGDTPRAAFIKAQANFDELYVADSTANYKKANILGVVSQASGVPTGAIIQTGTNANGTYIRYADGTQICTSAGLVPAAGVGNVYWAFPIAFAAPPPFASLTPVIGAGSDPRGYATAIQYASAATTQVIFCTYMAGSVGCSACAIGRWF